VKTRAALVALSIIVAPATDAAARPKLTAAEVAHLEKGANLEYSDKVAGSGVMMGKATGLIHDNPEAVLYVLMDVGAYKSYMPRLTESRVTKRVGPHTFGVFETSLPWPAKDAWVYLKYTLYRRPGRVYEVKWWMLNGTFRNYTGGALVEPWTADGKSSTLTYTLLVEPKLAAPDATISKGARKVANVFVQRIRLRLLALRKFGKLPKGM
jgi:hypothetical protein